MLRRRLLALIVASPVLPGAGLSFASETEPKKKGGGQNFMQLPTLTANALRSNGRRGVLTVDSGLDIKDGALRARAEQSIPRLRAAYNEALQTQAQAITPGAPPNPDLIVQSLQRVTDQTLGRPGAKFLIGAVMIN